MEPEVCNNPEHKHGKLAHCYHKCRTALSDWGFWIGLTIGFPIEHFLWEHVVPFKWLTELFHLGAQH